MGWFGEASRNTKYTSKEKIIEQLEEKRPLPLGRKDFEQWSDRIIAGAMIPGATIASQKWTLANLLLHLSPTSDHETDLYFIKALRKLAVNQVADAIRTELREQEKARLVKEENEKQLLSPNETKVLANTKV